MNKIKTAQLHEENQNELTKEDEKILISLVSFLLIIIVLINCFN